MDEKVKVLKDRIQKADELVELLDCVNSIRAEIWESKEYSSKECKHKAYAFSSELLAVVGQNSRYKELLPILEEYVDIKSKLEVLEDNIRDFIFAQTTFFIPIAIANVAQPSTNCFVLTLTNIGFIFLMFFFIEIIVFSFYFAFIRPKQINHKAFYNFAIKTLFDENTASSKHEN